MKTRTPNESSFIFIMKGGEEMDKSPFIIKEQMNLSVSAKEEATALSRDEMTAVAMEKILNIFAELKVNIDFSIEILEKSKQALLKCTLVHSKYE